jgi:hypothetical protein
MENNSMFNKEFKGLIKDGTELPEKGNIEGDFYVTSEGAEFNYLNGEWSINGESLAKAEVKLKVETVETINGNQVEFVKTVGNCKVYITKYTKDKVVYFTQDDLVIDFIEGTSIKFNEK